MSRNAKIFNIVGNFWQTIVSITLKEGGLKILKKIKKTGIMTQDQFFDKIGFVFKLLLNKLK